MKPLTGRTIVVTRPREQAGPLCEGIAAAGGTPIAFPLLEIAALPDDPAFELAMAALDQAALAVFISPNAVTFGLAQSGSAQSGLAQAGLTPVRRQRDWPSNLPVAAVGQGTARTLREHGFAQVIVPDDGFDSEALLACPELAAERLGGKTVLLFKGEGGRDLLASTLNDRGATVLPAPCYRRLPPQGDIASLLSLDAQGQLSAIVVSSSEAVRYLGDLVPSSQRHLFDHVVLFCSHPRIAEAARAIGCKKICLTPPGDAGILGGMSEYNWPSH